MVNTASHAGLISVRNKGPYSATKWGVNSLTKTAALEYGPSRIRVNSICPGMTLTPLIEKFLREAPDQADSIQNKIPLQRIGTPEEQANAVVWLCSDLASYITGVNLLVDGGLGAQ